MNKEDLIKLLKESAYRPKALVGLNHLPDNLAPQELIAALNSNPDIANTYQNGTEWASSSLRKKINRAGHKVGLRRGRFIYNGVSEYTTKRQILLENSISELVALDKNDLNSIINNDKDSARMLLVKLSSFFNLDNK